MIMGNLGSVAICRHVNLGRFYIKYYVSFWWASRLNIYEPPVSIFFLHPCSACAKDTQKNFANKFLSIKWLMKHRKNSKPDTMIHTVSLAVQPAVIYLVLLSINATATSLWC